MPKVARLFASMTCLCLLIGLPNLALADWKNPFGTSSGAADFRKRAESKKQSRWTLQEWLEQKERNRMMDLWLGMYEPSPYELILGGQYLSYDSVTGANSENRSHATSTSGSLAFFALILGVEGSYENNVTERIQTAEGLVHLRILGNSNQSTHLNLSYGSRKKTIEGVDLSQQVAGAELDLYIEKHLGLHGRYRQYLPTEEDHFGRTEGHRHEVGAFFDIEFMRVFGNWFVEEETSTSTTNETRRDRRGVEYGLRFYF